MEVTFLVNARIMGYQPGQIIKAKLTPLLRATLEKDVHLQLIDPPELPEEDSDGSTESTSNPKKRRSPSK